VRDTKKEKLFERAKIRPTRILMHILTAEIGGVAKSLVKKFNLAFAH
jgi:hypothetical protein